MPVCAPVAMEAVRPVRTPLYGAHMKLGAHMVNFHGYELPIRYKTIQGEHLACRSEAGLFDVSHMGFFSFEGPRVREWLSSVSTQDVTKFDANRCGYTHFLDASGYIIDDMIFAVSSEEVIYGVPNASMVDVVREWLTQQNPSEMGIMITDLSDQTSILALQGPHAPEIAKLVFGERGYPGRFRCGTIPDNPWGFKGWIQGTGYTGEEGVEIFIPNDIAVDVWNVIMEQGADLGVTPVGLGARDTLRLEKGYLLSGQDFLWPGLGDGLLGPLPAKYLCRTSLEANIPFGLNLDHNFIGKDAMIRGKATNTLWMGLMCTGKGPSPRTGHEVHSSPVEDSLIGFVTSGAPSPSLGVGIGMAYMENVAEGDTVFIKTSPRRIIEAKVKAPPFV